MAPNKFIQNHNIDFGEIETVVMRGNIGRPYSNVVDLSDGSAIGIRAVAEKDAVTSFEVVMNDSAELVVQMHTTPYADTAQQEHGLRISIRNQQTTLDGNKHVETPYPVNGTPFKVVLVSDGHVTSITIGCTTLPIISRTVPSSEWTILKATGATVRIIDPLIGSEIDILENSNER